MVIVISKELVIDIICGEWGCGTCGGGGGGGWEMVAAGLCGGGIAHDPRWREMG